MPSPATAEPGGHRRTDAGHHQVADFVHAAYSGCEALDFFQTWQEAGLSRCMPLSCGGFAVEDYLLGRHGAGAAGATSGLGWATELAGPGRREEDAADVFWAMDHDAAALVAHSRQACGVRFDPEAFLAALGSAEVDGARGPIRGDPVIRHAAGPLYLRVVAAGDRGWHNRIARQLARPSSDAVGDALAAAPAAGWINEYLCT